MKPISNELDAIAGLPGQSTARLGFALVSAGIRATCIALETGQPANL